MQLLHEFNNLEGKDMMETMKTNWRQICEQLKSTSESDPTAEEKNVLLKVEKNVYHRKTASPVVIEEVCILSFALNIYPGVGCVQPCPQAPLSFNIQCVTLKTCMHGMSLGMRLCKLWFREILWSYLSKVLRNIILSSLCFNPCKLQWEIYHLLDHSCNKYWNLIGWWQGCLIYPYKISIYPYKFRILIQNYMI